MNLKEHIRKVLKEETYFKISDDKYSKLIKDAVLDFVDFNICTLVVSALESIEDQYLVILITDKQLKSYYREELQEYLNNYIPLKAIYVSVSDGQDCQNYKKGRSQQEQIARIQSTMGVIKENLTFYHGGLSPEATLSDIDVFRLSSRQQKRGRDYAGFYMSPDIEADSFALQYHKSNEGSGLHKITLPSDAKAYEYPSSMERITRTELIDLFEKGYDYISGKNLFGNPEYILLNKNIADLELVSNDTGDDETSYRLDIDSDNDETLEEMKEGELTERCWKGYTQKGMKTMFGKRYPNCVKKKK